MRHTPEVLRDIQFNVDRRPRAHFLSSPARPPSFPTSGAALRSSPFLPQTTTVFGVKASLASKVRFGTTFVYLRAEDTLSVADPSGRKELSSTLLTSTSPLPSTPPTAHSTLKAESPVNSLSGTPSLCFCRKSYPSCGRCSRLPASAIRSLPSPSRLTDQLRSSFLRR